MYTPVASHRPLCSPYPGHSLYSFISRERKRNDIPYCCSALSHLPVYLCVLSVDDDPASPPALLRRPFFSWIRFNRLITHSPTPPARPPSIAYMSPTLRTPRPSFHPCLPSPYPCLAYHLSHAAPSPDTNTSIIYQSVSPSSYHSKHDHEYPNSTVVFYTFYTTLFVSLSFLISFNQVLRFYGALFGHLRLDSTRPHSDFLANHA